MINTLNETFSCINYIPENSIIFKKSHLIFYTLCKTTDFKLFIVKQ